MEVIITEWALQSYLELKARGVFTDNEYRFQLRPDVDLLITDDPFDPNNAKFSQSKFWGPATLSGKIIKFGHKMKWHNIGPGKIQLRLCIVIMNKCAFLCQAYVKDNKTEVREMARLKIRIQKIIDQTYEYRGNL